MRHRIVSGFGLGNPDKILLDNKGTINNEFADDAIAIYFNKEEGFDFQIKEDSITIGIEPAYMYGALKLVSINKDKSKSYIQTGRAWGSYGSQIAKTTKLYSDYRYKGKFVKFVDKWHEILFNGNNENKK